MTESAVRLTPYGAAMGLLLVVASSCDRSPSEQQKGGPADGGDAAVDANASCPPNSPRILNSKRLERGQFRVPQVATDANTIMVDATELAMLLDGIDMVAVKRPRRWEPPASAVAAQAP